MYVYLYTFKYINILIYILLFQKKTFSTVKDVKILEKR